MSRPDWSTIKTGDVFEVNFPHTDDPLFLGMVTRYHADEVMLRDIRLTPAPGDSDETWADESTEWVNQDSLWLPEGSPELRVMQHRPEFEIWTDTTANVLKSFGVQQPDVPTGLSLDQLLQHENGRFILAFQPPPDHGTAQFMMPFRNHMGGGHIVRQHVTVFAMESEHLRRLPGSPTADSHGSTPYRHVLPPGCRYGYVDEGTVLTAQGGYLGIGTHFKSYQQNPEREHGRLHWHNLGHGTRFAVETAVLRQAGIKLSGL